jgi:ribose 5-phosphate isomerase A
MLADMLDIIPGVVEHGLFIGIADEAILAGPEGVAELRAEDDDDLS